MASITDRWHVRGKDGALQRTERYGTGLRYQARWRERPGGPQKTRQFARKIDAEQFLDSIRGGLVAGNYVDPNLGKQTFVAFADEWAAAQDWKATTRESWSPVRKRLIPLLGERPIAMIDTLVLASARTELGKQYAHNTVVTTMSYATAIMRAAHAAGRIGRDPTKGLKQKKARADEADGKVGPDDVPTREEATAILAGAPTSYRAAIALGVTGLRVGEVLGMSADRIDPERRLVTVDRQLQRIDGALVLTTPKAEKTRTIKVPGFVALELRRHLRDHAGGLLFGGRRGTPMMRRDQFYASAWKPALRAAGLPEDRFVFHSLRHFCASQLLAEGAPLTAVAGHLGDTVETVSRVYAHWLRDDRDVPAEVLDRLFAVSEADASTG